MKRAAAFCFLLLIVMIVATLCQSALNPEVFTGQWYASENQCAYLFQEGIVYCARNPVMLSETEHISGAYTFCSGSVFLFAEGVPGLEKEKQLYLVRKDGGSFLCENPDGSGTIYFIRYNA